MITYFVKGSDNFQKRIYRTLPDALIIMRQKLDELERTWFDEGQKMDLRGSEEITHDIGRYLLLDGDATVYIQVNGFVKIYHVAHSKAISGSRVGDRHCISIHQEEHRPKKKEQHTFILIFASFKLIAAREKGRHHLS